MKKLVLALLTLSVMAVAHPDRKAPPPPKPKKHHPVKVVERPLPKHVMISPIHHAVGDGVYTVRYRPGFNSNQIKVCDARNCTTYSDVNYSVNGNVFTIHLMNGDRSYNTDYFNIEITTYR